MTNAQINYRALEENKRHNRAQESDWAQQRELSRYATDVQAETSRYSADVHASASLASTEMQTAASRYATDVGAASQAYRTDVESKDRAARLEFERRTESVRQALNSMQYNLDKLKTNADIDYKQAQAEKMAKDVEVAMETLAQNARALDLKDLETQADVALKKAQKLETQVKIGRNIIGGIGDLKDLVTGSYAGILKSLYSPD